MRVQNIIRTRCLWCGALIDETDLDEQIAYPTEQGPPPSPVEEDGTPKIQWAGLVAIEEHGEGTALGFRGRWAVDDPVDAKIPDDSCMALSAEVTR